MIDDLERLLKEAVVVQVKAYSLLSWHLPGGTEENN
jgi:hypothetical protein